MIRLIESDAPDDYLVHENYVVRYVSIVDGVPSRHIHVCSDLHVARRICRQIGRNAIVLSPKPKQALRLVA